ncbi:hypothetical protein LMH87_006855 [Akanthomyces muscarius]|uniref:N-acetyltransferase domain-containing protein n=1 Tax=Akanthomyces muscarius TaxID=2231603 RepID=A0A9W8QRL9_AKAMU|nr:hypothetical protein LMH87_006855 [Akanthomyces muscarius]KAJ4165214.1 hypothetical protein LMH87_006855 [Akanthomyces muscarius]
MFPPLLLTSQPTQPCSKRPPSSVPRRPAARPAPSSSRLHDSSCAASSPRTRLSSDAPLLARAANHRAVWDGVRDSFPHPYTLADAEAFVTPSPDPTQRGLPNPTKVAVCVKILPADDDHGSQAQQLVGCIGADPGQDVLYRTWELGYWLTPAAWGRGYATEATGALLRWLLGRGLACGFVLEGVQREAAEKGGVLQDLHLYAVLRRDVNLAEETTKTFT